MAKLLEEDQEASAAPAGDLPAELADVLEVMQALVSDLGMPWEAFLWIAAGSVGCFSPSGVRWAQPGEGKRQVPGGRPGIPGTGHIRPTLVPSGSAMARPATPTRRPLSSSRSG